MSSIRKIAYFGYKILFVYKAPFRYLYYRYFIAPKIMCVKTPLERPVTHDNLSIHMLTCHRDALIALWSLASYYHFSKVIGNLVLHNDGTLTSSDLALFRRLFPSATIVHVKDFLSLHQSVLIDYPVLQKFREVYPKFQSKKLIDVYVERKGDFVLYLDSDLLWFKNPTEIYDVVANDMHNVSYMMSNGSERVHVTFRDGTKTSDAVAEYNSGVTLYHIDNYELREVEKYVSACDYMGKKFTDQACFGTVLKNVQILPRDKYFIKGEITDTTVMRHYTGPSREKFYFYGINFIYKKILNGNSSTRI